jgi:hypothetical protein
MKRNIKQILIAAVFMLGFALTAQTHNVYAVYSCGTYGAGSYGSEDGCTPANSGSTSKNPTGGTTTTPSDSTDATDTPKESDSDKSDTDTDTAIETGSNTETEATSETSQSPNYFMWFLIALALLIGAFLLFILFKKRKDNEDTNSHNF